MRDLSAEDAEELRAFLEKRKWFEAKLEVSRIDPGHLIQLRELISFPSFSSRRTRYIHSSIRYWSQLKH